MKPVGGWRVESAKEFTFYPLGQQSEVPADFEEK
jgi:hypothetical protein